jgi:D-alanyl-D-alanine carboxypeptidase/D-alanyl-D-alanine-endopeptidase (penicillin-binding protein 4)
MAVAYQEQIRITTKTQASILSKIYRDSLMYPAFNASLPIAGKNGSMTNLCKGTFAEGNMRAKTGYINRARGYCGYVKTKSGKELASPYYLIITIVRLKK